MNLTDFPRIFNTKDLYVRPSKPEDAESMFTMLSDPQSMKYWSDQPISDMREAIEVLNKDLESDAQGKSMCWAVCLKGQDKMIGKCILFQFSHDNHRAEIGYLLNREYWRQGLMQQALAAVIDFAFNTLKLHRIEADVDTENAASLGLLEKLGFKREGLFRERWFVYNEWQDSVMLGLLKQDWLEKNPQFPSSKRIAKITTTTVTTPPKQEQCQRRESQHHANLQGFSADQVEPSR